MDFEVVFAFDSGFSFDKHQGSAPQMSEVTPRRAISAAAAGAMIVGLVASIGWLFGLGFFVGIGLAALAIRDRWASRSET